MKRLFASLLVLALAMGAALLRMPGREPALEVAGARALALRRLELTLATGHVPRADRYLAHPRALALPSACLLEGVLARIANAVLPSNRGEAALRGIDAGDLERFAEHTALALAFLAALAAWVAARAMGCSASTAVLAPASFACLPALLEHAASQPPGGAALEALLVFAQLGLGAMLLRARQPADRWLAAMGLGLAAGLSLSASSGGALVPMVLVSCLASWGARAPELRAPAILVALVVLLVAGIGGGWPPGVVGPGESRHFGWQQAWWRLGVIPLALLLLVRERSRREIVLLLAVTIAALVAAAVAPRFRSVLDLTGCVALASGAHSLEARRWLQDRAPAARLLLPALVLLPAFVFTRGERPPGAVAPLHFLRTSTHSPGPWNHPDAPQAFAVLTLPSWGALVAHQGRRPVLAIASDPLGAEERDLYLLLLQRSTAVFVAAARERGVRYVALLPGMQADERLLSLLALEPDLPRVEGSVLQRLLERGEEDLAGLVRVPAEGPWKLFEVSPP